MTVVGLAADGDEAVELAHRLSPDVVLMDLRMPNTDGVAATRRLSTELPDVKVVVLTTFADDSSIIGALEAGATGFLTKDAGREQIALAVRSAAAGQSVLDPAVQASLLRAASPSVRVARGPGPAGIRVTRWPDTEGSRRTARDRGRADQRRDRRRALYLRSHGEEPHQSSVRQDRARSRAEAVATPTTTAWSRRARDRAEDVSQAGPIRRCGEYQLVGA